MQTFLPYASFRETARVLDRQRLGKQRVETLQIVKTLVTGKGWVNHPATKMWDGYLDALVAYQRAICFEWRNNRGYRDTCLDKTIDLAGTIGGDGVVRPGERHAPPWLGDPDLHRSHRSNLLRKNPAHYSSYFADVPDDLPYVWPSRASSSSCPCTSGAFVHSCFEHRCYGASHGPSCPWERR